MQGCGAWGQGVCRLCACRAPGSQPAWGLDSGPSVWVHGPRLWFRVGVHSGGSGHRVHGPGCFGMQGPGAGCKAQVQAQTMQRPGSRQVHSPGSQFRAQHPSCRLHSAWVLGAWPRIRGQLGPAPNSNQCHMHPALPGWVGLCTVDPGHMWAMHPETGPAAMHLGTGHWIWAVSSDPGPCMHPAPRHSAAFNLGAGL